MLRTIARPKPLPVPGGCVATHGALEDALLLVLRNPRPGVAYPQRGGVVSEVDDDATSGRRVAQRVVEDVADRLGAGCACFRPPLMSNVERPLFGSEIGNLGVGSGSKGVVPGIAFGQRRSLSAGLAHEA